MFTSSTRRHSPDVVSAALGLVAGVEAASRVIGGTPRPATFEVQGRRVLRVSGNDAVGSGTGPDPAHGERLLGHAATSPQVRVEHSLAVDEIRLAKLGSGPVRLRAFYAAQGVTACIHTKAGWRPPRLRVAARVLQQMHRSGQVAAPALLEHGSTRGAYWLLEELVAGDHPSPQERSAVALTLLPQLLDVGADLGWHRRRVSSVMPRGGVRAVLDLLDGAAATQHAPLAALVRGLLSDSRSVVTALGHGDPVLSNVLRTPEGNLVLLDWELAGRLPVGHDAAKLVLAAGDAMDLLAAAEPGFVAQARSTDLPWSRQVAVGVVRTLSGWRRQQLTAAASGRAASYDRSLLRRLTLLGDLLGR